MWPSFTSLYPQSSEHALWAVRGPSCCFPHPPLRDANKGSAGNPTQHGWRALVLFGAVGSVCAACSWWGRGSPALPGPPQGWLRSVFSEGSSPRSPCAWESQSIPPGSPGQCRTRPGVSSEMILCPPLVLSPKDEVKEAPRDGCAPSSLTSQMWTLRPREGEGLGRGDSACVW